MEKRRPPQPGISTNHIDYSRHGQWVRSRGDDRVGRIGCEADDGVSVCWEGGGTGWYRDADLEPLNQPPEPWYGAEDLLRRRTDGRTDDIWWAGDA